MPYLFQQWGGVLAILAGVFWFGLLFFAGITSSLAMGTPWMGLCQMNLVGLKIKMVFGALALLWDYQRLFSIIKEFLINTIIGQEPSSLVVFAFLETVLFSYVLESIEVGKKSIKVLILKLPQFINM